MPRFEATLPCMYGPTSPAATSGLHAVHDLCRMRRFVQDSNGVVKTGVGGQSMRRSTGVQQRIEGMPGEVGILITSRLGVLLTCRAMCRRGSSDMCLT